MDAGAGHGLTLLAGGGRGGGAVAPRPRPGSAAARSLLRLQIEERLSRGLDELLAAFEARPGEDERALPGPPATPSTRRPASPG